MVSGEVFGIDVHEPAEALPTLSPVIPCAVQPLNSEGYADYLWTGVDGRQQVERKTWYEILADLDSIENQLRRQLQAHPNVRLILVVEGVAVPSPTGTTVFKETTKGKRHLFYAGKSYFLGPMKGAYAWLYEVGKYIEVHQTPTYGSTLNMLTQFYKADQKEGHTTFQRYLKEMTFHPNPMVVRLMGMGSHLGIGPARAEALIRKFGTVYNVATASPEQLAAIDGMGKAIAVKFLRGIGRPDV
ncbi:hypothetical protein LCGC14_1349100 [marine sediment metagenome]|uniref:DisA/LigA helix-hairpin-helix motif domain-containing protein n=1 Tax=marine sediment metagenome TaxID=412755 RepID=A0A0F9MS91_9ZZZZ